MFFDRLFGLLSHDVAIDLGTANTLVAVRGKGIMIREPTVVVRHKKTKQIIAVGNEAKQMLGKTPSNLEAIRPLQHGVIADFDATEALLTIWIKQIHEPGGLLPRLPKPRVIIGIPSGITEVERRAVQEAALRAGARQVWLVEEPMAAAIGSGSPVEEPTGILVVDIGGGTTEIAAISLSGMVVKRSIRMAGDEMDLAIVNYIRTEHSLLIGEATAERLKLSLGSALGLQDTAFMAKNRRPGIKKVRVRDPHRSEVMVVRGRDLEKGLPKSLAITEVEVREAISGVLKQILDAVEDTIEEVPPELVADILERGIVLAGGGSLLSGLDQLMAEQTKMPVWVAEDPLTCVARGCLALYDKPELLERVRLVGGLK